MLALLKKKIAFISPLNFAFCAGFTDTLDDSMHDVEEKVVRRMDENKQYGEGYAKMEFAVSMVNESCKEAVRNALNQLNGIRSLVINVTEQRVVLETNQASSVVQDVLEETGMTTALRGLGGVQGKQHLGAAVSILKGDPVYGVVRFVQITENECVIDGSFDGLQPGSHALHIHEAGDLSQGAESTGEVFNPDSVSPTNGKRLLGDLGNICADESGHSVFRCVHPKIKVWDIIGRGMVVHEAGCGPHIDDHKQAGKGLAVGIVARSAGLFENKKKICQCSGKTIWEEREYVKENPLAPL